jgi:hypothetical protein
MLASQVPRILVRNLIRSLQSGFTGSQRNVAMRITPMVGQNRQHHVPRKRRRIRARGKSAAPPSNSPVLLEISMKNGTCSKRRYCSSLSISHEYVPQLSFARVRAHPS